VPLRYFLQDLWRRVCVCVCAYPCMCLHVVQSLGGPLRLLYYLREDLRRGLQMNTFKSILSNRYYGVATVSRIDKIIGLFCRILSLL